MHTAPALALLLFDLLIYVGKDRCEHVKFRLT
jgi:hypothetical protein